jgi:hypothetical protein
MSDTSFQKIFALLSQAQIEYIVIGGLATTIHGLAYVTYDVDICYRRSEANVERLCRTLATVHPTLRGAPPGLPFRLDVAAVFAGLNFTLETDIGPLDLLGEVQPFGEYPQVVQVSEEAALFGFQVRVLSLAALIQAKQHAGRSKDQLIIPALEALLELRKRPPL